MKMTGVSVLLAFFSICSYGLNARADCFVALRNGYVQDSPKDEGLILDVLNKWDVIEDLFIHKADDYYVFEGREFDFRIKKAGWAYWKESRKDPPGYVGCYKPRTGSVGNILILNAFGKESETIETKGIVIKYTGPRQTRKMEWLKPFLIQKVRYYPIKIQRRYVKSNIGVVLYDDYEDVLRRVRHIQFRTHYPQQLMMCILEGKVMKGMTQEQVVASWGKPNEIKKSFGSWGRQHVLKYYKRRLNFENGVLTLIKTY